jgi:FkbM family methyltransferase
VLRYKQLYPKAHIIAFEPDKDICEVLRKNLAVNQIDDVEVVEAAIWTRNDRATFFAQGADGGHIVDEAAATNNGGRGVHYWIDTVRLADYLATDRVDLVKLDIEGAEADVLIDCAERLRNVENMVIEFHFMNDSPKKLPPALSALSAAGFNLSINSYGNWVDLLHPPAGRPAIDSGYDQYFLTCAWRPHEESTQRRRGAEGQR